MVLSTLADLIYNFFLLLYYILKTCVFIGYVLFDIVYHVSSAVRWAMKNIHLFIAVVNEDNQSFIQDVISIVRGTSHFFVNNIAAAYATGRNIADVIYKTAVTLVGLPSHIFETIKQDLILIGESVWFLFTLPVQLAVLLRDLTVYWAYSLVDASQAGLIKCIDSVTAFVHYTTHDIPFEAACGLVLLVLFYNFSIPKKIALKLVLVAARSVYQVLRSLVRKFIRLLNVIQTGICTIFNNIYENIAVHQLRDMLVQICIYVHGFAEVVYDTGIKPMLIVIYRIFPIQGTQLRWWQRQERHPADVSPGREISQPVTIGLCIICADKDRSVAFVPCGHICLCKSCAKNLCYYNPICPLCRSYIRQKLEIYI